MLLVFCSTTDYSPTSIRVFAFLNETTTMTAGCVVGTISRFLLFHDACSLKFHQPSPVCTALPYRDAGKGCGQGWGRVMLHVLLFLVDC